MHLNILFLILFSTTLTLLINVNVIQISKLKHLFDVPNELRKVHKIATPNLGGIGIYFSFVIMILFYYSIYFSQIPISYILLSSLILFGVGLKDDLIGLSPIKKLATQIIAAFIIAFFTDIRINNLDGFLNLTLLPRQISILFTIIYIVFICNSFNLIDGINGLAGSISVLICSIIAVYFYNVGQLNWSYMTIILIGAIIGFLIFNFGNAKIFMGDTGSYFIGLIVSIFSIKIINNESSYLPHDSSVAIVFSILIIPLYDTLRVIVVRIVGFKNPFKADKNHLHHILYERTNNHIHITIILLVINLLIYMFNKQAIFLGNFFLIVIDISFMIFIFNILLRKRQ